MKECTPQRDGGMTPQGGDGYFYRLGPKKLGCFYTFSAPKAPRKFLNTFFEIFVKFVNKNAIKSDFWGDLCRSISKIFEKSSFLAKKKYFYKFQNFRKYFYRSGVTPSPKISLILNVDNVQIMTQKTGN